MRARSGDLAVSAPMSRRRRSHPERRRRLRALWAAFTAVLVGLPLMAGLALPAAAQAQYLTVNKTVDAAEELLPGNPFTYTIAVNCAEADCENAQLDDAFPAELEGFPLNNVTFSPGTGEVPRAVTWTEGDETLTERPVAIGPATALQVDFQQNLASGELGLIAGQDFTITLALTVPEGQPSTEATDVVNTAETTADNSFDDDSSATISVRTPASFNVQASKSWTPSEQPFNPGDESTISLGVASDSNVPVDSLVIQEPATAAEGTGELDPSNPFIITDFTGFSGSSLPAGADAVQVDAYVFNEAAGTWGWVTGVPGPDPALPEGVDPADVAGVRLTYTGEIEPEATGAIDLVLEQRSTHRNTGDDLSTETHAVTNVVEGTATLVGFEDATDQASAEYAIIPANVAASASKNIETNRIGAGESTTATLGGTNASDVGVNELRISDLDFFTADITFGGFDSAPLWPPAATDAVVIYHPFDGEPVEISFSDGGIPADPETDISGFEIVFTATDGGIAPNSTANATFTIDTAEDATGEAAEIRAHNTVDVEVTAPNGLTGTDSDSDYLELISPGIEVTLDKTVRPSAAVEPGERVISSLTATANALSDNSTVNEIVVEDYRSDGETEFWDAFDLSAIAPTQVPANAAMTMEVRDGEEWVAVTTEAARSEAWIFSLNRAQLESALTNVDVDRGAVEGIRFTFANEAGFPDQTTVTPNVTSEARSELRAGGRTTPIPDEDPTYATYENTATATATGQSTAETPLDDRASDTGEAEIVTYPGAPGPLGIDKRWTEDAVVAQSSNQASTVLSWRVAADSSFSEVTITDPINQQPVEDTLFDAFDLVAIDSIPANDEPFTNGWYLLYDDITAVQLHDGDEWVTLDAPDGGWIQNGSFVGYELTAAERESSIGVQWVLEENTGAREAAQDDPFAPEPGSGIAAGPARSLTLDWQVRDQKRSDGTWVTESEVYNVADDEGVVDNTVQLIGVPEEGDPSTATANDTILILDSDPAVNLTKSVTLVGDDGNNRLITPPEDTPQGDYPAATYELVANNASTSRASYVRVTDPATCSDTALGECQSEGTTAGATANPFTADVDWLDAPGGQANIFDRFTLTGVQISADIPEQVDLAESTVWLLRYDGNNYTTAETTAAEVNDLPATDLADVVGISVTFQGSDPDVTGGTITQDNDLRVTLETQLRSDVRSTGATQVLPAPATHDVNNRGFAQSYDPILADGQTTGDTANATVVLTGGEINVGPTKSITPSEIIEPNPDVEVTVTLGADQGTNPRSTLSPNRVVIEDQADSPDFWNTFTLTGLGELDLPQGADRVQVDVYGPFGEDDEVSWFEGEPAADAQLPDVELADVQGVRITFDRADGELFSATVPAPNWSGSLEFTYELRDTYRDTDEPVEFTGTVSNTQTSQSLRDDGNNSGPKDADASIDLSRGTQELSVEKLANNGNRTGNRGESYPWALTFENSGTGYLTVTELRDTLPEHLLYLGEDPEYTADPEGSLSEDVTLEVEGQDLIFTWPEDGNSMQPGESFTIQIPLELGLGAPANENVINTMTVRTEQELTSCSHIGNGSTTGAWGEDPTTCGTTDYMTPSNIASIFSAKGVMGSLDGAHNPANADTVCSPTLTQGDDAYYRFPCVANSQIGGVDDWLLRSANSGGTGIAELTIFEQLPVEGDQLLLTGNARGSQYRPQLVEDSLQTHAPEGTTITVEVTSSSGVCVGTWTDLENHEVCEQNNEVWHEAGDDTEWESVSGLRVHFDFSSTPAGVLRTGETADVTFSTENVPATEADPSGAPVEVGSDDSVAWNQMGMKFRYANTQVFDKRLPAQVGVHLLFGSVEIHKDITGPAAQYAAAELLVDLEGYIGDVDLDFGEQATVTLSEENDYTVRVDGIPYATNPQTVVEVSEHGEPGSFGETSRTINPADGVLTLTEPTDPSIPAEEQDVPAGQIATVTNDYQFTGLSVTKEVNTEATEGEFGPFDFTLQCTSITGQEVVFDDDGTTLIEFTLEDGETFTAPEDRIPVGADCLLTEVNSSFADEIVIVGANVENHGDGGATITPGIEPAEVTVTNGYDAGVIEIAKLVDGEGAELYGQGPFGFDAVCTYQDQTLLEESFDLEPGSTRSFGVFPAGTECEVTETGIGGATNAALDPENGTVVIPSPEDPEETLTAQVDVTATNTFDLGQLEIAKRIEGDGAELYGEGPFEAQAMCTWDRDGEQVAIDLPNDGLVVLSEENGYSATIGDLLVGAECTVTETMTGGATATSIDPVDGVVTVPGHDDEGEQEAVTVTLTNTFDLGQLELTKLVEGAGAELYGEGPFEAQVMCTWDRNDEQVDIDLPNDGRVELSAANGYTATIEDLLVGAECTVTETLTGGATATSVDPAEGVTVPGHDDEGEQQAATVTLMNTFDLGQLELTKFVEGAGAELYGEGPFEAQVMCTWDRDGDQVDIDLPNDGRVELSAANGYTATIEDLLVGAECTVTETLTGGATATSFEPADGTVTVPPNSQEGAPQAVTVTVINTFDLGQVEIAKLIDGAGAELYGEGPFEAQVMCTWDRDGEPQDIELPNDGVVTLSQENGYAATIDDLLVGAECAITETLTGGATATSIDPVDGAVTVPGHDDEGAQQATIVTLTNTFDVGQLELTKLIDGAGGEIYGDGPFEAQVMCTWDRDGDQVDIELPNDGRVALSAANDYTATVEDLLVGAECTVTETLTGGATATSIDPVDGAVTIPGHNDEGEQQATAVTLTNTFDVGQLEIAKLIEGPGAELYGEGPFEAQVMCTWDRDGESVAVDLPDDGLVTLSAANDYQATVEDLLVGAECEVTETRTGGATSSTIDPDGGVVTIPGHDDEGEQQAVTATLTNTFGVTSLDVAKEIQGNLAAPGTAGPFTVDLVCTWDVDGTTTEVDIPGGSERELDEANGFEASYDSLPIGAVCELTETDAQDADGTLLTVVIDGQEPQTTEGTTAEVDLSTTTEPGQAQVIVTNSFDEQPVPPTLPDAGTRAGGLVIAAILLVLTGGGALLVRNRMRTSRG